MASLKKVTTARGVERYRVRWRVDGRLIEKWFTTYGAANAHKTNVEKAALDGTAIDPRRSARTLNDYFDEWLRCRLVKGRPLTPSTRYGYRCLWKRHVEPTIGRRKLRDVRSETIRRWNAEIAASNRSQAAKAYRVVRAVLNTAVADDILALNPCKVRGAGQEHAAERPMIPTSLVLDLADAIDPRYRAFVLLAGFAGLRTGESLGLRRCDVDLLRRTVRVVVQAQEVRGAGRITLEPKSEAGRRSIAVPAVVAEALQDHLLAYPADAPDAPVFVAPWGGPVRRASVSAAWRAAKAAVDAPAELRPHDLRHHAATLAARTPGITTKELMARIGHASPRAALIYQHATSERDEAIASFLDEQIASAQRSRLAPVVALHGGSRGVCVGLAPNGDTDDVDAATARTGPDLRRRRSQDLEAARGIEPLYRALQALA